MPSIVDITFYEEKNIFTVDALMQRHAGSWEQYLHLPEAYAITLIKFAKFRYSGTFHTFRLEVLPLPKVFLRGGSFENLLKCSQPDFVVSHSLQFPTKQLMLNAVLPDSCKIFVQLHGDQLSKFGMKRWLQRLAFSKIAVLLVCGKEQALPFLRSKIISSQTEVIEMMEGSTLFSQTAIEHQHTTPLKLLWIGRLLANKDPICFLKACAILKRRGVNFEATMLYSIPQLLPEVQETIRKLGLGQQARLQSQIAHQEVELLLKQVHVYVSTSLREGSNWSLVEAMACGKGCIVSDIPSHAWMCAKGKAGILFPCGEPEMLSEAIISMQSNYKAYTTAATLQFEKVLSFKAIALHLQQLIAVQKPA